MATILREFALDFRYSSNVAKQLHFDTQQTTFILIVIFENSLPSSSQLPLFIIWQL